MSAATRKAGHAGAPSMSNSLFSLSPQASIAVSPRLQHAIHMLQLSSAEFVS
jgi:hypothetical protein